MYRLINVLLVCVYMLTLCGCQIRRERKKRAFKHLGYENCGDIDKHSVHVQNASAYPMPIPSPGKLRVSTAINVTRELPQSLALDLTLWKFIWGIKIKIPCWANQVGSCYYKEVCPFLSSYEMNGCPKMFRRHSLPCHCPFHQGFYTTNKLPFRIPSLSGYPDLFIKGSYQAEVRLYDHNTDTELGCVRVLFSIRKRKKKKSKGWFFN